MENKISLNGKWNLYIATNDEYLAINEPTCERQLENAKFLKLDGTVPGNFELDMRAAGFIEDPFYGENILKLQEYEDRHLWYCRKFIFDSLDDDGRVLVFKGIDTFAEIYINGQKLAETENMLISYRIPVSGKLLKENEIMVHIKPTVIEAQKYNIEPCSYIYQTYNAGSLAVRKAPHMYGWDIMPRAISGGIWKDVYIETKPKNHIEEIYMFTVKSENNNAEVWTYFRISPLDKIKGYKLRLIGVCGESSFDKEFPLWHNEGKMVINLENPKLWWPKNMGEPNLYKVTAELLYDNEVKDSFKFNFGIRTVRLDRTSLTDNDGNGQFRFYVNNQPMFVMGTNWTPLDAFHSRDKERLPKALQLLDELGCNMVRCWGGNVYEDKEFFDFCDSHGIAVWQDFAMGCAAYPQNDDFCNRFKYEAEYVVRNLRQHTSLILWAGDNECDEALTEWSSLTSNPENNKLTRIVLPDVIRRLDPIRTFLPSSPYVDKIAFEARKFQNLPEKHLWGPRDYFKGDFYRNALAHFASETGYHGCPDTESIKEFISPGKEWPWKNNDEWLIHAACMEKGENVPYSYRIPLMVSQVQTLFGKVPENLEEFALESQISQAEAMKYFIERFRTAKWRRTGIIWWNLIDGWPQFSDSVVDYYYRKKLAYYYIKRSQQPVCLMFAEPDNGYLKLIAANDLCSDTEVEYTVKDLTDKKTVLSGKNLLNKFSSIEIGKVIFDNSKPHFYHLIWYTDGKKLENHYWSGTPPYDIDEYLKCAKKAELINL